MWNIARAFLYLLNLTFRMYLHARSSKQHLGVIYDRYLADKKLKSEIIDKIKYSRVGSIVISSVYVSEYAKLINRNIKHDENLAGIIIAGCIPIFDALSDSLKLSRIQLFNIIQKPNEYKSSHVYEVLFLELYSKLMTLDGGKIHKRLLPNLLKITQIQHESLKQHEENLALHDLNYITNKKGGLSMQIIADTFDMKKDEAIENALNKIGAWVQVADDIADEEKDTREGITTFANHHLTKNNKFEILEKYRIQAADAVMNLKLSQKAKKKFLFHLLYQQSLLHIHI